MNKLQSRHTNWLIKNIKLKKVKFSKTWYSYQETEFKLLIIYFLKFRKDSGQSCKSCKITLSSTVYCRAVEVYIYQEIVEEKRVNSVSVYSLDLKLRFSIIGFSGGVLWNQNLRVYYRQNICILDTQLFTPSVGNNAGDKRGGWRSLPERYLMNSDFLKGRMECRITVLIA